MKSMKFLRKSDNWTKKIQRMKLGAPSSEKQKVQKEKEKGVIREENTNGQKDSSIYI